MLNSNEAAVTDGWKLLCALWNVLDSMGVLGCVWTQVNNNHGLGFHLNSLLSVPIWHGMSISDVLYWSNQNCTPFTAALLKFYCFWAESGHTAWGRASLFNDSAVSNH